jgi:protein-disulfide isomerase/uncharacterized membrane protein
MPNMVLLRLATLVALAASAALFVHYVDPVEASFCAAESGCEKVRRSAFSYFGTPLLNLPLLGLIAYGTVFVTSLRSPGGPIAPRLALAGGVGGAAFLALQIFVVGAMCWLCVVVDVAALTAGLFGWLSLRRGPGADPLKIGAWGAIAAITLVAPPLWTRVRPGPPVPASVRALYEPAKINVVEFADFECPFCRRLHPVLKQAISELPEGSVHFVRMNVPLPHHQYAETFAKAHICADQQGKGEAMADVLMTEEPGPKVVEQALDHLALDPARFKTCLEADSTAERIERETQVLRDADMLGLPTTYIEGKRFVGSVGIEALRDALGRAQRGETKSGLPLPGFLGLLAAALGASAWFGRRRPEAA